MIPMSRLRLKSPTGWFAAGEEMAAALSLLSDAAFKLYVFLCLNVDRHSGRMAWEPLELANRLQRDRQGVADALEELCRRGVCVRHPDAGGRIATDRLCIEILDRFWPYEKPPIEEFGIDQNSYVRQVRQMLSGTACMRVDFSCADERLAAIYYRSGVSLVHLQYAIWLGCARKYVSMLNGTESSPMPAILLPSCERSRGDTGRGGLLETHAEQSEPVGADVEGSPLQPDSKRDEIMPITPRSIKRLLADPGHAYNLSAPGDF